MEWALRQSTKSAGARVALFVLAFRANDAGVAWPSVQRLALDMGMAERGARRAVSELETAGLVKRERRYRRSNVFHLLLTDTMVPGTAMPGTVVPGMAMSSDRHDGAPRTENELKEDFLLRRPPAVTAVVEPVGVAPTDARSAVWGEGVGLLMQITGKPSGAARSLMGKLLKLAGDDCAGVLLALRECPRTGDPVAWLMAGAKARGQRHFRNGFFTVIAEEGHPQPEDSDPVTSYLENYRCVS